MLIVDGRQSRLDRGFVSYINNKDHEWESVLVFHIHQSCGKLEMHGNSMVHLKSSG